MIHNRLQPENLYFHPYSTVGVRANMEKQIEKIPLFKTDEHKQDSGADSLRKKIKWNKIHIHQPTPSYPQ